MTDENKFKIKLTCLILLLAILFFLCFLVGRYKIPPLTVFDVIYSQFFECKRYWDPTLETVILDVRLPRILAAILIGGALSLSGAAYQSLFKNPLVSPDILGVSAGAGFGASLAMLCEGSWGLIQGYAFIFGSLSVIFSFLISKIFGKGDITVLVLAGIAVAGLFRAFISILKYLADPTDTLPSIVFWLMGSLAKVSNSDVFLIAPFILLACFMLFLIRHQVNALSAGSQVAATMGVNVSFVKTVIVISATMLTVSAVSIAGIIGWVGLIIPHMARMISGASFQRQLSSSFLLGGIFLLVVDNIARGVGDNELPLGVLTALVGTPAFVFLLSRVKRGW